MKNVKIELSYNKDGFHMNQWKVLFYEHITEQTMKEAVQQIKKIVRNVLKTDDITIDVMEHEFGGTVSKMRYCLNHWGENGNSKMDYRPFNGYDFSDVHDLTFCDNSQMVLWLGKSIKDEIRKIIPDIPVIDSRYALSIRNED